MYYLVLIFALQIYYNSFFKLINIYLKIKEEGLKSISPKSLCLAIIQLLQVLPPAVLPLRGLPAQASSVLTRVLRVLP